MSVISLKIVGNVITADGKIVADVPFEMEVGVPHVPSIGEVIQIVASNKAGEKQEIHAVVRSVETRLECYYNDGSDARDASMPEGPHLEGHGYEVRVVAWRTSGDISNIVR